MQYTKKFCGDGGVRSNQIDILSVLSNACARNMLSVAVGDSIAVQLLFTIQAYPEPAGAAILETVKTIF